MCLYNTLCACHRTWCPGKAIMTPGCLISAVARCRFERSAEEAVVSPSAAPCSWWGAGERPRSCTSPQSRPGCVHPSFDWKSGNTSTSKRLGAGGCQTRTPCPSPPESTETWSIWGPGKDTSLFTFSGFGQGGNVLLQLVKRKPFSANPLPGEQMQEVRSWVC